MKRLGLRKMGFTLVELLVVLSIISLLLTIGVPRYFHSVDLSREQVLRADLAAMRHVLDKYYEDHGVYPENLTELVGKHYLRAIPVDPLTGKADSWVAVPPDTPEKGGVADLRSGAEGKALDGSAYGDW